jgi:hypothetical protein
MLAKTLATSRHTGGRLRLEFARPRELLQGCPARSRSGEQQRTCAEQLIAAVSPSVTRTLLAAAARGSGSPQLRSGSCHSSNCLES